MVVQPEVMLWGWTSHDLSSGSDTTTILVTVPAALGTFWKLSLGVAIGLSWPCAARILTRIWEWMRVFRNWLNRRIGSESEQQPLLSENRAELGGDPGPSTTSEIDPAVDRNNVHDDTPPSREATREPEDHPTKSRYCSTKKTIWSNIGVLLAASAVMFAYAGALVGEMPTNNTALANSADCGFWDLNRNTDWRIQDNDDLIQARKEMEAGHYAKSCYGEQLTAQSEQCNIFQPPVIAYQKEKINCPFPCRDPNKCICANGIYRSAVRFDTGTFRLDKLGLNAAHLPLVRRTSTFVPLDIEYGFVDAIPDDKAFWKFEYYLGPINDSAGYRNFTFVSRGYPFNWGVADYAVSVYEATPSGPDHDAWDPIPDLERGTNTFMTVVFVSSCRILYNGPCTDPVFPANLKYTPNGRPFPKYVNNNPRPES
ncbi:hypothetical protein PG991_000655 [Apiospora marii]|uniref:Uncharacterized protein n=1 Tax=Apiospora marii TaxID=335849 RepID=A0ABR1SUE7_9PEZI